MKRSFTEEGYKNLVLSKIGKRNPMWRGGKPLCQKCSQVTHYQNKSGLCISCFRFVMVGEKSPFWKGGTKAAEKRRSLKPKTIQQRLRVSMRNRLKDALKGRKKSSSIMLLLGCSLDDFKIYIEKKFKPGMTWKNWSLKGWHLDHVIPCASFDLRKKKNQAKCFHYSNLQPLWGSANQSKGKKIL